MLRPAEETAGQQGEGSMLGAGWREVASFDELDELEDEYEYAEEELFAVLDLGQGIDPKMLITEGTYQLIGMDTATPFLKIGNNVFRGKKEELIGDEVIMDLVRDPEDPQHPNHPPRYISSHRIGFKPVLLRSFNGDAPINAEAGPSSPRASASEEFAEKHVRSMFMKRAAMIGPNAQTQAERDAAKRASSAAGSTLAASSAMGAYGEEDELEDEELRQIADGALNLRDPASIAAQGGDPLAIAYKAGTASGTIPRSRAPRYGVEFGNRAAGRPKGSGKIPRILVHTKEELEALPFTDMDPRSKVELHFLDPPELLNLRQAERRVYGIPERGPGSRMLASLGKIPIGMRDTGGSEAQNAAMALDEYGAPLTSGAASTGGFATSIAPVPDDSMMPSENDGAAGADAGEVAADEAPTGVGAPHLSPGFRFVTGGVGPPRSHKAKPRPPKAPPEDGADMADQTPDA